MMFVNVEKTRKTKAFFMFVCYYQTQNDRPKVNLNATEKVYTTDSATITCLHHFSPFSHLSQFSGTHHTDTIHKILTQLKICTKESFQVYNLPIPCGFHPLRTSRLSFPALWFHLKTTNVIINISHKILSTKQKQERRVVFL